MVQSHNRCFNIFFLVLVASFVISYEAVQWEQRKNVGKNKDALIPDLNEPTNKLNSSRAQQNVKREINYNFQRPKLRHFHHFRVSNHHQRASLFSFILHVWSYLLLRRFVWCYYYYFIFSFSFHLSTCSPFDYYCMMFRVLVILLVWVTERSSSKNAKQRENQEWKKRN